MIAPEPPKIQIYDHQIKVGVIIFAALTPFILIFSQGTMPSISAYWRTDLQPLFIIANAATTYYLYSVKNWRASALMLLLLTAFSVDLYRGIHDLLAFIFFIITLYPLYKAKYYRWTILIYLTSLPIFFFNMLWAEIVAIESLCLHHGLVMYRYHKVINQYKKRDE